ncbi:MAG: hypothetical protein OXC40_01205 [Proteobacteria bacterium]|nr:hypothetical protein [Pseudomonadota bacterium]
MFSQDDLTAQEPHLTRPRALLNEYISHPQIGEVTSKYADDISNSLAYFDDFTYRVAINSKLMLLTGTGNFHYHNQMITLGACPADSGGPIVKKIASDHNIHIAVVGYALHPEGSRCGEGVFSVRTFPHLGWITAAKNSMEAGHHSYKKYRVATLMRKSTEELREKWKERFPDSQRTDEEQDN